MSEPHTDDFAMVTRIRLHDDDSEATMQTVAHGLQKGMVLITPDLEASSEDEEMVVEIDATAYGTIETLTTVLSMVVQTLETHEVTPVSEKPPLLVRPQHWSRHA